MLVQRSTRQKVTWIVLSFHMVLCNVVVSKHCGLFKELLSKVSLRTLRHLSSFGGAAVCSLHLHFLCKARFQMLVPSKHFCSMNTTRTFTCFISEVFVMNYFVHRNIQVVRRFTLRSFVYFLNLLLQMHTSMSEYHRFL